MSNVGKSATTWLGERRLPMNNPLSKKEQKTASNTWFLVSRDSYFLVKPLTKYFDYRSS